MKKHINQGRPFEGEIDVEGDEKGKGKYRLSLRVRDIIALIVVVLTAISLAISFVLGAIDGSYDELKAAFMASSGVLGTIIGYYFRGSADD